MRKHPRPFRGGSPWQEAERAFRHFANNDGIADCYDTEECDGLDNDGDGATDEGFDADSDGVADCYDTVDCDDCDDSDDSDDQRPLPSGEENWERVKRAWRAPHRDPRRRERVFQAQMKSW